MCAKALFSEVTLLPKGVKFSSTEWMRPGVELGVIRVADGKKERCCKADRCEPRRLTH